MPLLHRCQDNTTSPTPRKWQIKFAPCYIIRRAHKQKLQKISPIAHKAQTQSPTRTQRITPHLHGNLYCPAQKIAPHVPDYAIWGGFLRKKISPHIKMGRDFANDCWICQMSYLQTKGPTPLRSKPKICCWLRDYFLGFLMLACAAAKRAIGTR